MKEKQIGLCEENGDVDLASYVIHDASIHHIHLSDECDIIIQLDAHTNHLAADEKRVIRLFFSDWKSISFEMDEKVGDRTVSSFNDWYLGFLPKVLSLSVVRGEEGLRYSFFLAGLDTVTITAESAPKAVELLGYEENENRPLFCCERSFRSTRDAGASQNFDYELTVYHERYPK